jgi:hypothetical protein
MKNTLDLKNLEKKAFRATHQDGLWDIYMGGVVMSMAILAYSEASEAFPLLRFSIFLFGLGASYLIFWAGKKYITTPRLGQVKFGPQRQNRKRTLAMVLAGMVFVQVVFLIGTIFLWRNPQWAASLGFGQTNPDLERLMVAVVGALFVGPSVALIAYFNDFTRGYYIAFIMSLGSILIDLVRRTNLPDRRWPGDPYSGRSSFHPLLTRASTPADRGHPWLRRCQHRTWPVSPRSTGSCTNRPA